LRTNQLLFWLCLSLFLLLGVACSEHLGSKNELPQPESSPREQAPAKESQQETALPSEPSPTPDANTTPETNTEQPQTPDLQPEAPSQPDQPVIERTPPKEEEMHPEPTQERFVPPDTGPNPIKWASLQWPPTVTVQANQKTRNIYGQLYVPGLTDKHKTSAIPGLRVELGVGPLDQDPRQPGNTWKWDKQVTYYKNAGIQQNNQEYKGNLLVSTPGYYRYTFRYSLNNGPWLYADRSDFGRKGTDDGASLENMGVLVVVKPKSSIKVASYNLHCLVESPTKRMQEITKGILSHNIDIIGFQEVCKPVQGGIYSIKNIAQQLGQAGKKYYYHFINTHVATHRGKQYHEGLGVLSRFPIIETKTLSLPPTPKPPAGAFPRKGLWTRIATPTGVLSFVSTHLSFRREHEWWRTKQVEALKTAMASKEHDGAAIVVVGDFNASPTTPPIKTMEKANSPAQTPAFTNVMSKFDSGLTYPAKSPTIRIDYIFHHIPTHSPVKTTFTSGKRIFVKPIQGLYLSDHVGVMATMQLE